MKRGLVLGGAATLWDDLAALEEIMGGPWDGIVAAVNDAGCDYPGRVDHWVSLHPDEFPARVRRREANGYPPAGKLWGALIECEDRDDRSYPWVDDVAEVTRVGSSGLHAVEVLLGPCGCERVALCGVPMTPTPHYNRDGKAWRDALGHQEAWINALPEFGGRVRSLSGWTAELLGTPTRAWLERGGYIVGNLYWSAST